MNKGHDPFEEIAQEAWPVIEQLLARAPDESSAKADAAVLPFAPPASVPAADDQAPKRRRKRAAKDDADGAGDDLAPRSWGYSVEQLNEEYALVLMGSKAVVFLEQPDAPVSDQQRFLTIEAFNAWFANRFTEYIDRNGDKKVVTWAKAWLQNRDRRSYKGIEFHPDPENAPGTRGYLNLWSGFAVEPAPKHNGYSIFRDHVFNNVCGGDPDLYNWVSGFFAQMVQAPRERPGVALVLRGKMGSGKTKVGEVFGSLFPRHYFLVDDPRYVTGQFNAHMATCLLLQADEAVWAGDKAAEGRLKGLITAPIQQIEAKGIDPIRLPNYVRLIMTSNEDWVVPAGKDERRFAVLDVDPRVAQNRDYFREMDEELKGGGLAALLHDLMAFNLSSIELGRIPRTAALLEQKVRSLNSIDSWWLERLMAGTATRAGSHWPDMVPCASLFDDYLAAAERIGIKRKQEEIVFGIAMAKLVPGLGKKRTTAELKDSSGVLQLRRAWCYVLPPLEECRAAWDAALNQPMSWPSDDGPGANPRGESEEFA